MDKDNLQVRHHIRKVLRLIEEHTDRLESDQDDDRSRQLAAAGLMRCCALVRGICVLEDACLKALTGILERQNWEMWLVSRYILLRGDEAIAEIQGDYVKSTKTLGKALGLEPKHVLDWDGKEEKLIIRQLSAKLEPLLLEVGDTEGAKLAGAYDQIYRGGSQYAVHAGLSTLGLYTRIEDGRVSVEPNPPAPFDDIGRIPLFCTLHLAGLVFERFGIATDALESIRVGILADFGEPTS